MEAIEIRTIDTSYGKRTRISVGGKEIQNVRGVRFEQCAGEIPMLEIKTCGYPKFNIDDSLVKFNFDVETLQSAANIIRNQLMFDNSFYKGFKESIKSALIEAPAESGFDKLATKIIDRIIGEDVLFEE